MPDKEKVIKELKAARLFFEMGSNRADGVVGNLGCKSGMKYIDDALELLKEQSWISVKDRLPNCNGCYLVWRPHFYPDKGMPSICYFDWQNTWHDSYCVDFTRTLKPEDVSHWKPLPEQP